MKQPYATAVGVGLTGGVATFLFLQIGTLLIWAAFVAWASFFALGGNVSVIKLNITSNILGVVVAWAAALAALSNPSSAISAPIWIGLVVMISIAIYISLSKINAFSSVPATTFGYASTFAFLTQTPGAFSHEKMLSASFENVLIIVPISMVLGTGLAFVSGWLSGVMAGGEAEIAE